MLYDILKIGVVFLLRTILKIFWILPVKQNRILFFSFSGKQYSDNPKYLCTELSARSMEYEIVWVLNDPEKWKAYIPQSYKVIPAKGMRFLLYALTAKAVVTNSSISSYIPIRKSQILLETWHGGGGLKRCDPNGTYDKFTFMIVGNEVSGVVESSRFVTEELFKKSFGYTDCDFIRSGMPRNSILYTNNDEIRQKVYDYFGVEDIENTALLLYAPTFRNSFQNAVFLQSEEKLDTVSLLNKLEKKFQKRFLLLFRAHHSFAEGFSDTDYLDATNYPDVQELLYASAVLLTDYSSCMWDMSLMKKPIFLYTPDLDDYLSEKGFYCDFLNLPFPIARDQATLEKLVSEFDQVSYVKKVGAYLSEMGSYESPDSAKKVCDWLVNRMQAK